MKIRNLKPRGSDHLSFVITLAVRRPESPVDRPAAAPAVAEATSLENDDTTTKTRA